MKQKSEPEFYKIAPRLALDLARVKAPWSVWAMMCILFEAWYNTGYRSNHLNPFPLSKCDFKKWGLSRVQKHRALELLTDLGWISIDQSNPKEPLVTLLQPPLKSQKTRKLAFHPGNAAFQPGNARFTQETLSLGKTRSG
jgi:hypothetical protein